MENWNYEPAKAYADSIDDMTTRRLTQFFLTQFFFLAFHKHAVPENGEIDLLCYVKITEEIVKQHDLIKFGVYKAKTLIQRGMRCRMNWKKLNKRELEQIGHTLRGCLVPRKGRSNAPRNCTTKERRFSRTLNLPNWHSSSMDECGGPRRKGHAHRALHGSQDHAGLRIDGEPVDCSPMPCAPSRSRRRLCAGEELAARDKERWRSRAVKSLGGFATLTAVSPEFDSGMNEGTDGEELERLQNFYNGTEENPTAAQSAPTPRAEQQVNAVSARPAAARQSAT